MSKMTDSRAVEVLERLENALPVIGVMGWPLGVEAVQHAIARLREPAGVEWLADMSDDDLRDVIYAEPNIAVRLAKALTQQTAHAAPAVVNVGGLKVPADKAATRARATADTLAARHRILQGVVSGKADPLDGEAASLLRAGANALEALAPKPPSEAQAQGGGEACNCPGEGKLDPALHAPNCPARTAPPSAPVGVELLCRVYADAYHHGHHATVEGGYVDVLPVDRDTYWLDTVEEQYSDALAQQPAPSAPVGVEGLREIYSAVIRALAAIVTTGGSDKIEELGAIPRSPVMDQVAAIRWQMDKLSALAQQPAAHPDDAAVDAFAGAMKEKLAAARAKGRGGWDGDEPGMQQRLSNMLRAHVEKGDPRDVANFAMFLHQRGEAILPAQQPAAVAPVGVEAEHVETLRRVMGLLRDTAALQGREHISLGIAFADAIDHFYLLAQQPAAVECPHRTRCDCLVACKYGMAGGGALAAQPQGGA